MSQRDAHPASQLFVTSPVLKTVPAVRAFFDLMERWYGKAAKNAVRNDFFPEDLPCMFRGLMFLGGLAPGKNAQGHEVHAIDLYGEARTAILRLPPPVPGAKSPFDQTRDVLANNFDLAASSLVYGIRRATVGVRARTALKLGADHEASIIPIRQSA